MSLSALRTGAGLVTAAVPRSILLEVARITPELMTTPLDENGTEESGGLSLDTLAPDRLGALLKGIKVVGVGPGLGQAGTTPEFVRRFIDHVTLPMVLDADALNCLVGHTELLKRASAARDAQGHPRVVVLTPHPGEMARLIGGTVKDVEADRVGLARRFATEHGVTLVLKGWRTLIAHPDGRIAVNTTGNPSMAKGGSGDILTGIVAAMLAQFSGQVAEAVEAAVFLHGLAGDFACLEQDEHTVLATDTVAHLAAAFQSRVTDADGFTWLTGTAANHTRVTPARKGLHR
jgi:ADP-dependent NAD(P)H-hydrate dehydratase / NAD(P)H-hydrate epimerase